MLRNSRPFSTPAVSAEPFVPCPVPEMVVMTDKEAKRPEIKRRFIGVKAFSHERRIARDYTGRMHMRSNAGRKRPRTADLKISAMAVVFLGVVAQPMSVVRATAQSRDLPAPQPIAYTVRFEPATHVAQIDATFPTDRRSSIDVMMAIWSPGFYRVENYATRIRSISARIDRGTAVGVAPIRPNRWRVDTDGAPSVTVSYRLYSVERSVTTNWVSDEYAILNGPSTFMTIADGIRRRHEVRIVLPPHWSRAMTALEQMPDSPTHYAAADFDTLVDSPIVVGNPAVNQF